MMYPELAALDSTPDQDLGLTIEWKTLVNAKATATTTAGEYLAERVSAVLEDLRLQRVATVQETRVVDAVKADVGKAAASLGVDITVTPPDDVVGPILPSPAVPVVP